MFDKTVFKFLILLTTSQSPNDESTHLKQMENTKLVDR